MKQSGNTVLITGGSAGIGLALAEKFLAENNEVIICGRTKGTLDEIKQRFPEIHTFVADVSSEIGRESLIKEIKNRFPRLNVLVNNAGIYSITDILEANYKNTLESQLATNLLAPVALIQGLMPVIEKQEKPLIINITTGYVFISSAQSSAYSASKLALRTITQSLRFGLRHTNVKVVEVIPPAVDTQMNAGKKIDLMSTEKFAQQVFKGLVNGHDEIIIGMSKVGKLLSRIAPKFAYQKLNTDEERVRLGK